MLESLREECRPSSPDTAMQLIDAMIVEDELEYLSADESQRWQNLHDCYLLELSDFNWRAGRTEPPPKWIAHQWLFGRGLTYATVGLYFERFPVRRVIWELWESSVCCRERPLQRLLELQPPADFPQQWPQSALLPRLPTCDPCLLATEALIADELTSAQLELSAWPLVPTPESEAIVFSATRGTWTFQRWRREWRIFPTADPDAIETAKTRRELSRIAVRLGMTPNPSPAGSSSALDNLISGELAAPHHNSVERPCN